MNREKAGKMAEVMKAYAEGKDVQLYIGGDWITIEDPKFNNFEVEYRIKPEPAKRYMTRNEVLAFVTFTLGLIVRRCGYCDRYPITPASSDDYADYEDDPAEYEWAYAKFDDNGKPTGGWHKFEVEK